MAIAKTGILQSKNRYGNISEPSSACPSACLAHRPRVAGSEAHPRALVMETLTPFPPLTILAIDDNPADISTVQRVLTAHALTYDLQVIKNANLAFAFFDQLAAPEPPRCPDMLLLDLTLPQRHGTELWRHLTAIPACAAMPVVILTASRAPADRAETLVLGADVFFEKPFHLPDFLPLGTFIKTLAMRHPSVHTTRGVSTCGRRARGCGRRVKPWLPECRSYVPGVCNGYGRPPCGS